MAVMAREAWTDNRLDDLNKKVDEGFKEMREEFRAMRAETKGELQAIRAEIGALNRTVAQLAYGLIGALLVGFLGTIVAIVTQI